tara:strand:+ start:26373 stop:26906 length:534 start_codon:yes stop_codon:yes gene_type:complete
LKGKFFGIFLFFCFLAPIATTFIVLKIQKKQVKREVKWKMIAGIKKEQLVLLKFTEEEKHSKLNWKHSKEFEFNGEMYDITSSEVIGDTTYYWCWWDHEETKLNKQLDNLLAYTLGNNPKNQESKKRLHQFFKSLYFSESTEENSLAFQHEKQLCATTPNFYQSISKSPPIPPPELS